METDELQRLRRRAAWIGQGESSEPVESFTSLFLAFLAADDALSSWAQEKATWIGPTLDDIVRQWNQHSGLPRGLDENRVRAARGRQVAELPATWRTTPSATALLTTARDLATSISPDAAADVRHLFAAFLYRPSGHQADLVGWGFHREAWATRFRCFVTASSPAEAAGWRAVHDEAFPRTYSEQAEALLRRATAIARQRSSTAIDSADFLQAVLNRGVELDGSEAACEQIVSYLGGRDAISSLLPDVSRDDDRTMEALPPSDELGAVADRALVFALATRVPLARRDIEPAAVHVRHLVAALLTDRRPLPAFALLHQARRTREGVLARFRRWLDSFEGRADDLAMSKLLFEELREDVLAGYHNDEASGEDSLAIGPDVRALAAILASTKVSPPLSVGLFGDWGSGKSFFMAKLKERVTRLEATARARSDGESWFCGRRGAVVQIDFNAWHYADADIWSSLAVRVFGELNAAFSKDFAAGCVRELSSVKERTAELEAETARLAVSAKAIDERLTEQRSIRETRKVSLAEYLGGLAVRVSGEIEANTSVVEVKDRLRLAGKATRAELARIRGDLDTMTGAVRRWWQTLRSPARLVTLALVLVAPAIAALVASHYVRVTGAAATALTAFSAILAGIGVHTRRIARSMKRLLAGALDEVDRIEAMARQEKSQQERLAEAEREQVDALVGELERERLQLASRKTELEQQIQALQAGDGRSLREFILERSSSTIYRRNLGVVSALHEDFKQLARLLQPSDSPPNVERIILYVDDLDRCPPTKVVEVLQAIHVILSLPLFVVVVAVDSRWLLDSLSSYYRQQFPGRDAEDDPARPQQYLEKIFQIPFTLTPMAPEGYASLVSSLLDAKGGDGAGDQMRARPGIAPPAHLGGTLGSISASMRSRPPQPRRSPDAANRVDLTPRALELEPHELEYAIKLGDLVTSPRAAKRFVNLYRIVRASLDDTALDRLLDGHYRITQLCLALVVGNATSGATLFDDILSGRVRSRSELDAWCRKDPPPADPAAIAAISRRSAEFADWDAVAVAVRRVARFSFETGRVLGRRPAGPTAAPAQ